MQFATVLTLLQYFGVFPVSYEDIFFSTNKRWTVPVSRKFLCCTVVQVVLLGLRLHNYLDMLKHFPPHLLLTMVVIAVYQSWTTSALLLSLKSVKCICRCIQLSITLLSGNTPRNSRTFRSFAFSNFCLQTGSATLILIQANNINSVMGLYRSTFHAAILSLATFNSVFIPVIINYFILMILKIMQESYIQVNQRLFVMSNRKSEQELTLEELEELVKKHWKTGNLLVILNRAFGLHILLFSSSTFAKITLTVYLLCVQDQIWTVEFVKDPTLFFSLYLSLYAIIISSLDFLLLCNASQQVFLKRQKTLVLLFRLLRRKSDAMTSEMNLQIRVLVYQARSRQLELSGCGFFLVKRPLYYGFCMHYRSAILWVLHVLVRVVEEHSTPASEEVLNSLLVIVLITCVRIFIFSNSLT